MVSIIHKMGKRFKFSNLSKIIYTRKRAVQQGNQDRTS